MSELGIPPPNEVSERFPAVGKSIAKLVPDRPGPAVTGRTENDVLLYGNIGIGVTAGSTGWGRSRARRATSFALAVFLSGNRENSV